MTTIQDLPEEILYMIFRKFEKRDLQRFQRVCRAWYFPAHITLLNAIDIAGVPALERFIKSIDCNPEPAYLKAVKSFDFYADADPFQLNDELNQKLFYRFPNLERVWLGEESSLVNFNDEMCKTFLKNCPKLDTFMVHNDSGPEPEYRDLIYKARLLATSIDVEKLEGTIQPDDLVQFLSNFPRLQDIYGFANKVLINFSQILQILEHAPPLTTFYMGSGDDRENLAEQYLKSKPKDEQDKLITRLSNIDDVHLYYSEDFCINSLRFAQKYLTGTKDFNICCEDNPNWTEEHRTVFCSVISEIHKFEKYHIEVNYMDYESISQCFSTAVLKGFSSTLKRRETRTLNVSTSDYVCLCISLDDSDSNVSLSFDNRLKLPGIAQLFFKTAYENVDKFNLEIKGREEETALCDYDMILGQMPCLKEVEVDITSGYVDTDAQNRCKFELPLVEDFTIRAAVDVKYQSLLDHYYFALPNLKRLTLLYDSGNWDKSAGEFRVILSKYSLEKLSLDVALVKTKTVQVLNKKDVDGFFVVEVEVLQTCERHLYKVSIDRTLVSRVDYGDLKGYIRGEDYYRVHVTIRNLQNLVLFAHDDCRWERPEPFSTPWQNYLQRVVLLENNQWKT